MQRLILWLALVSLLGAGCQKDYATKADIRDRVEQSELFIRSVDRLTEIQVHDIFSPPVASRVYAYPSIAAYEALRPAHPEKASFANRLNGLPPLDIEVDTGSVSYELAAIYVFNQLGRQLIFSEEKMAAWQAEIDSMVQSWQVDPRLVENSKAYAGQVGRQIMAWAGEDNYNETRGMPKFSVTNDPSRWKPTPPAYIEGIEPHWNKIRTMVLDSAAQYRPAPPPAYDMTEGSDFFQKVKEVYEVGVNLSDEQRLIASFWDCNPFVMNQTGHAMFATKKITPGGHWMGITGVACRTADADLMKTVEAHALVSIALFDGFISCWDEKYRSNLVRPETVINESIDPDWLPTLQTPPFPEHTSGHSVISTAAAVTLTAIFGDNFEFLDVVEVDYGLPERRFNSFLEASAEAAISRLYGGIHYMPAIEDGVAQGRKVGNHVVSKLVNSRS